MISLSILFFISSFFLPVMIIAKLGLFFLLFSAMKWGLKGGFISSIWASIALWVSYSISEPSFGFVGLLLPILAYFLVGFSLGQAMDLLKKKQIEIEEANVKSLKDLQKNSRYYEDLMNSTHDPLHVVDHSLVIVYVNRKMIEHVESLFFTSQIIGKSLPTLFSFLSNQSYNEYKEVFETGESIRVEERTELQNKVYYTETTKSPVFDDIGRVKYVITVVRDIAERKRAEQEAMEQQELQKLIMKLATRFINVPPERVESSIHEMLASIGVFTKTDRVYIFKHDYKNQVTSNTHEWCAEGIEPELENLQRIPFSLFSDILEDHKRGETYYIADVKAMPVDHPMRWIFLNQSIQSLILLPLVREKETIGFIGFDAVKEKRVFKEVEINLLKIVAEIISNALGRQKTEEGLLSKERETREAHKRLLTVLESMSALVYVLDIETYEVLYINQYGQKHWGDAVGEKCWQVLQKSQTKPCPFCANSRLLDAKGQPTGVRRDVIFNTKTGRWYDCWDNALYWIDGRLVYIKIALDITDRKRTEQELHTVNQEQELLLDNVEALIWYLTDAETFGKVNTAYANFQGLPKEEIERKTYWEVFSHENAEKFIQVNQEIFNKKETYSFKTWARNNSGEKRLLTVIKTPKLDNDQQVEFVVCSATDITELKMTENELDRRTQELEEEIHKAQEIHKRILPTSLPRVNDISFVAHYQPAKKIGGDFYDVIQAHNKLILYLSDVSGHGLDSAMLSFFIKHMIKGFTSFSSPSSITPATILQYLTEQFRQENYPEKYFICIFIGVLDLESMELVYSGMGFQDKPLALMGDGKRLELYSRGLFITSYLPTDLLNFKEHSITLTPGTTIFFNTDGLTEQGVSGAYYKDRLPQVFHKNAALPPHLISQSILSDFREFNQGSLQGDDDSTFLIMQIASDRKEELTFFSTFEEVPAVRDQVLLFATDLEESSMLLTCATELVINAMEHGNGMNPKKRVEVELALMAGYIRLIVEDEGEGFDWRKKIEEPLDLEGHSDRGRGIAMTQLFCDYLYYNEKGNQTTCLIKRKGVS